MRALFKLVLIVGGLVLAIGCSSSDSDSNNDIDLSNNACGVLGLKSLRPKIFDGSECSEKTSPVVELRVRFNLTEEFVCTGTLITSKEILTAAHCLRGPNNENPITATAIIGGKSIFAEAYKIHPSYRVETEAVFNDLAILRLPQRVSITPVGLLVSSATEAGDVLNIFGYGLDENGNLGTLKSGQILADRVTANHVVTIFGSDGSNTCTGDSGGPAIRVEDRNGSILTGVVGVTSYGDLEAECKEGDTTFFTRTDISASVNFIQTYAPGVQLL
ncbi:trypsin-like serine protease [bacterium]|nr:trypsin-like serine protease [bacterium]